MSHSRMDPENFLGGPASVQDGSEKVLPLQNPPWKIKVGSKPRLDPCMSLFANVLSAVHAQ